MKIALLPRIIFSLTVSAMLTSALYTWSCGYERHKQHETGLLWAKQVATQAEGMFFAARQNRESDPVGWTVGFLSQGTEPRILKVAKQPMDSSWSQQSEYSVDESLNVLEYRKLLDSEKGVGIKILIQLQWTGFLGASSRLLSDAYAVLLFLILGGAAFVGALPLFQRVPLLQGWIIKEEVESEPTPLMSQEDFKEKVRAWTKSSKSLLMQLGTHVRELIRVAKELVVAARHSRDALAGLRGQVHLGINRIRKLREIRSKSDRLAIEAEVLGMNLVIAMSKGSSAGEVSSIAEKLSDLVRQIAAIQTYGSAELEKLEKSLEPLSTDVDLAFHAYEQVFKSAREMDDHIRHAAEDMIGQAKLIQAINTESASDAKSA